MLMVTSSRNKFLETKEIASRLGIELEQKPMDILESRGTLEDIAKDKARKAYEATGQPVVCDDSGFFVDALKGFPAEFSAFALKRIGVPGIMKLMEGVADRGAEFRCAACYHDGKEFLVRLGVVRGTVPPEVRGSRGFGFDPIFIPAGRTKTFAEDYEYKGKVSHRRKAFQALFEELSKKLHEE
jgi:XTP/dITP diphosphohydrolase